MKEATVLFDNFSFTYDGAKQPALADVNLQVQEGESILITGPAGAGKTTLCSCLNGLVPHFFRGKIRNKVVVKGVDTRRSSIARLSHIVGLLFQDPSDQLVSPTVEDDVAFGPENYGVEREEIQQRVAESLSLVRLSGYEKRVPHTLSGGEQQACALAGVLAMRPEILALDEPTSNLDPLGSKEVLDIVSRMAREGRRTLIVVEHKLEDFLPLCDRLVVMDAGRIVLLGSPQELFTGGEVQVMKERGVNLPQVSLLGLRLCEESIWPEGQRLPITLGETKSALESILQGAWGRTQQRSAGAPGGPTEAASGKPVIEVQDLWHTYPGGTVALRGIDLTILENEFVAIVGQNGSGKTTLVKHFNGLLEPTRGRVIVEGRDAGGQSVTQLSQQVGYCFQNPDHQICCKTVREEFIFGPANLGVDEAVIQSRMEEIAGRMGLEAVFEKRPFGLSKGERQKLAVASILMMEPNVVIIDEPTTGQDYRMGREMMELARRLHSEGKTVIVITHDMGIVAEYVDRVVVLREGQVLLDGSAREVFMKPDVLAMTSLEPPQITRLGQELNGFGISVDVLTVEEMLGEVKRALESGRHSPLDGSEQRPGKV